VEDFLRLNLMSIIVLTGMLTMFVVLYFISIKYVHKDFKKQATIMAIIFIFIIMLVSVWTLLKQASVNNIPRSTIDRSYQDQKQESYQNNLNKDKK